MNPGEYKCAARTILSPLLGGHGLLKPDGPYSFEIERDSVSVALCCVYVEREREREREREKTERELVNNIP